MKQTLYDILEVAPDASFEDIEIAYTKRFEVLRTETSFDSNRLVMLHEAREVLSDPGRRAAYDASLAAAAQPELRFQAVEVEDAPRSPSKWILIGIVFAAIVIWWSMSDDTPRVPPQEAQPEPGAEAAAEALESDEIIVTLPESDRSEVDFPSLPLDEESDATDAASDLAEAEPAPATIDAPPAAVAAAPAALSPIVGYWDCFEPVTGRTSEYGFGADGTLTIQQGSGEVQSYAYNMAGNRINLTDIDPPLTIGVEELASRKLVLSASGIAQRVVCAR